MPKFHSKKGRDLFTLILRASRETGGYFSRKEAEVRRWSLSDMQPHKHVFINCWLDSEPNLASTVTNLQEEYLATTKIKQEWYGEIS
jgi:hypothetical protein